MSEDARIISEWNDGLAGPAVLTFLRSGEAVDEPFLRFCRALADGAPMVEVIPSAGPPGQPPALEIRPNLRYRAVPAGPELPPFLEALSGPVPEAPAAAADRDLPGGRLYIADGCPFCPTAVRAMLPLTAERIPLVDLTIIDAGMFPDEAAADGVRSVPTLILEDPFQGDRFRWTGTPDVSEIRSIIITRDASRMGAESMTRMIQEGDAAELAEMMLSRGQIFPKFIDLLTHEKWPTRLGAMVAAEVLAERSEELGRQLVAPLWERFPAVDAAVQGDILYILGVAGGSGVLSRLHSVLEGPYPPEVKEAATEAVESVRVESSGAAAPAPDRQPEMERSRTKGGDDERDPDDR